jgi:tRNA nucleotidyltransferase/poly(A) polymerase
MERNPVEVLKAELPLPESVRQLQRVFVKAGQPLLVVGGAVRDYVVAHLRGHTFEPKDFDLVTAAVPDDVEDIVRAARSQGVLSRQMDIRTVGKAFGVVLVSFRGGEDFEIATFRKDAPTGDGRRPDSVTFGTWTDDADRRDLTINALYYRIDTQEVIDFHGGIQHLRDNVVVFVGDPAHRLEEDRLRALRFVRFHGRVNPDGPATMNPAARAAIRQCTLLPAVSEERIRDEFLKGLASVLNVQTFVENVSDLGLLPQIFPDLIGPAHSVKQLLWTGPAGERLPAPFVIAQLLEGNVPKKVAARLNVLKYTNDEADDVWFLLKLPEYSLPESVVDFKRDAGRKTFSDELVRFYARQMGLPNADLIDRMLRFPYPNVRGEDLLAEGFSGPALGREQRAREIALFAKFLANP